MAKFKEWIGTLEERFQRYVEENKIYYKDGEWSRDYCEAYAFYKARQIATILNSPPKRFTPEDIWNSTSNVDTGKNEVRFLIDNSGRLLGTTLLITEDSSKAFPYICIEIEKSLVTVGGGTEKNHSLRSGRDSYPYDEYTVDIFGLQEYILNNVILPKLKRKKQLKHLLFMKSVRNKSDDD